MLLASWQSQVDHKHTHMSTQSVRVPYFTMVLIVWHSSNYVPQLLNHPNLSVWTWLDAMAAASKNLLQAVGCNRALRTHEGMHVFIFGE